MKILTRKSDITINSRKMRVGELIANLKSLPAKEVKDFFVKQKKMVPRSVRCEVLKTVLDGQLKEKKVTAMLTDEMNYRLNWYAKFSEYQLENLLAFFNNDGLVDLYKEELWLAIVSRHDDLKIDDLTLFTLYQKSINFRIEGDLQEGLMDYNRMLDCVFYDEEGFIDGLSLDDFREVLLQSSTLIELREIGTKYGIEVPRRIKKNELMDIILDELKSNGKYTIEVDEKVKKMSVVGLQRFAKDNNIKASIELKKEDIIEYIIKFMSTPVVPDGEKVVIETPQVVEEEIEEVIEEPADMNADVDFSNIDLADLFAPEEDTAKDDPAVVVPDASPRKVDSPVIEEPSFDDIMDMGDIGLDLEPMMEPEFDSPAVEEPTIETTNDEGDDPMAGFDMADLDIIMPDDMSSTDSIFQFEDAAYEEPTVNTATASNNIFDNPTATGNQAEIGGFKSELNEFNRKLESLLAFQMKMLEKNNNVGPQSDSKKATSGDKGTGDLFKTVAEEVKQEKIEQARGLDELRKMNDGKGDPSLTSKIIEQGSYLPNKKEQEKEIKKRQKERERAKKLMSPEELEIILEQEAREKEALKRVKDSEKAKQTAGGRNKGNKFGKILVTLIILAIIVLIFLGVVFVLCKNKIITDGFIRQIYDFFRDIYHTYLKK